MHNKANVATEGTDSMSGAIIPKKEGLAPAEIFDGTVKGSQE